MHKKNILKFLFIILFASVHLKARIKEPILCRKIIVAKP